MRVRCRRRACLLIRSSSAARRRIRRSRRCSPTPSLNQVLQQISQNPQKANELLSDPAIKDKFDTLVAAGMIRLGFPVCWEKRRIGNTKGKS